ncbi:MAG: Zn-dependent exopeptidase M28 [Clostridia bacterium]|nr:Zn-dependent exopeptidase M28 [Clostridia bacterium]
MKKQFLGLCAMLAVAGLLITACLWQARPMPPEPDPIAYLSALEPAPAAPEDFEMGAVLEYLCSTAFGGRQTGTDGCIAAGDYAAGFLEQWGYQPLFGDSLAVPYTGIVGDPALAEAQVILHLPNGDVQLTEGVDYTYSFHMEEIDATLPLSVEPEACAGGEAVLLWGEGVKRGDARITLRPANGILDSGSDVFGTGNDNLEDRRITLTDSAFALAEQAQTITLRMKANARELERNNYCAVLPGEDRTQAMVLCAHVDGTGTWGEVLYPSAHDNASGTVTLLECARQLAGDPLPHDLVFCIFTGEEQKLLGSKALAPLLEEHYDLINVINLDCLGWGDPEGLKLLGETAAALGEAMEIYLRAVGYTVMEPAVGASDQDAFTHPAIGLCELPEGYRFHQPNDTVDTVDPVWLQKIADMVCTYVENCDLITLEMEAEAQAERESVSWLEEELRRQTLAMQAVEQQAALEQRRLAAAANLAYDQGVWAAATEGGAVDTLFTGWRMLNSPAEVSQYYPDLQLPETVDGKAFFGAYVVAKAGAVQTGETGQKEGQKQNVDWDSLPTDSVWAYYMDNSGGFLLHVGGETFDRAGHPGGYESNLRQGYAHRGANGKFSSVCYLYRLREAEQPINGIHWEPVFGYCDTEEDMMRVRSEVKDTLEHLTVWYADHRE